MRIAFLGDGSLDHIRRWVGYFADQGHEVLLVSFERTDDCPFPARRLHKRLPTKLLGYLGALPAVRRELAAFGPDLVNALNVTGYGLIGAMSGIRPLAVTALGSDLLVDYPSHAIHRMQARYTLTRADLVTTDADILARIVSSTGVESERILTIYFGVDERIFHPTASDHHGKEGIRPVTIISTRNHYPIYNLDLLVEAAPLILEQEEARFILCGDGPMHAHLERKVDRWGLGERFTFTGMLNPADLAARLREADLYVSTSRSDSTSVSLLEAMASGIPPVVTDIPANREWIEDGVNGLLFESDDREELARAIVTMIRDDSLARSSHKRNLEIITNRGRWRPNLERLETAFRRLTTTD
ncbi:MAG: glycosyltransferase family 4 protein [bacterium]|nr:MAG: glycosyltransferase family 4 protein [bacterium]